jgi:hypothetical protein
MSERNRMSPLPHVALRIDIEQADDIAAMLTALAPRIAGFVTELEAAGVTVAVFVAIDRAP